MKNCKEYSQADDVVPQSMDTPHGGFYISRGKVEPRILHGDDSSDDDVPVRKKKPKTTDNVVVSLFSSNLVITVYCSLAATMIHQISPRQNK